MAEFDLYLRYDAPSCQFRKALGRVTKQGTDHSLILSGISPEGG